VYYRLFTRPDAWWRFDAKEQRRLLKGDPENVVPGCRFSQGTPTQFKSFEAWKTMQYESEAAYLRRHNLLITQKESARGGETAEESSVLVDVRQRKTR
jgi:hypothetical protein